MNTYLFRYYHAGKWWGLDIEADSAEDAEARLRKLPLAQYDGELVASVAGPDWLDGAAIAVARRLMT